MSDTIKGALIIGVSLILGLCCHGCLSKSGVGRFQSVKKENARLREYAVWHTFDTTTGDFEKATDFMEEINRR